MSMAESLPYRSPLSKLLRFFLGSRDKWRAKCKEAKRENKSLKLCLAKMKESRDRWKARAMAREDDDPPGGPKNDPKPQRAGTPSRAIWPR